MKFDSYSSSEFNFKLLIFIIDFLRNTYFLFEYIPRYAKPDIWVVSTKTFISQLDQFSLYMYFYLFSCILIGENKLLVVFSYFKIKW